MAANSRSTEWQQFMNIVVAPSFNPDIAPAITKGVDFNGNLYLWSVAQGNETWAWFRKKGINPEVQEALNFAERIDRALRGYFFPIEDALSPKKSDAP